ncbi:MAG TPA: hypothetical protein VGK53_16210, partial [Propionicimonas sp.]
MPESPVLLEEFPAAAPEPRLLRAGRLLSVLAAVVAVDWSSKAVAWRLLTGFAVINADTSGALPILPGLVSQPVLGAVVDAAVLLLLVVSGLWLARTPTLGTVAWTGSALVWAGITSNAVDRWIGHLWLAPGSQRGAVDWIGVAGRGTINLADVTIGFGLLLAIAALAGTRIPRKARAAVAAGVLLLVPISVATASGAANNAEAPPPAPTFAQQVRGTLWVWSKYEGRRVVYRQTPPVAGWNVTVDAVDANDRVLAQWHLTSESKVGILRLPKGTSAIYVTLDATGEV